jgi:hypothetical protein
MKEKDPISPGRPTSVRGVFTRLFASAKSTHKKLEETLEGDFDLCKAVKHLPPDELLSAGYLDRVDNIDDELQAAENTIVEIRNQLLETRQYLEEVVDRSEKPADDSEYEDTDDDTDKVESIAAIRKRQKAGNKKPEKKRVLKKKAPAKK